MVALDVASDNGFAIPQPFCGVMIIKCIIVAAALTVLAACSSTGTPTPVARTQLEDPGMSRQDLEWVNDISRRVLIDPKVHQAAADGVRSLLDSVWYAVLQEARTNPTGPRHSLAAFVKTVESLPWSEKTRRYPIWFAQAGWAVYGEPNRQHPDFLLRLSGERYDLPSVRPALDRVFGQRPITFIPPWIADVSGHPALVMMSPGVPVVNRRRVALISTRVRGRYSDIVPRLERVMGAIVTTEEAVHWRLQEASALSRPFSLPGGYAPIRNFNGYNVVNLIGMAVAMNADKIAFEYYVRELRLCGDDLDKDWCRHLYLMKELLATSEQSRSAMIKVTLVQASTGESVATGSTISRTQPEYDALVESVRRHYTLLAQHLVYELFPQAALQ